jgi:hypothetical protein
MNIQTINTKPQGLNNQETSESYLQIILNIGDKHRVIQCKDNIQWIVQYQCGLNDAGKRYRNLSYIRTKNLLIDACRSVCPQLGQPELYILDKLPDVCGVMS